jgi:hypothetical protein
MELGIHGVLQHTDADLVAELGVTWTKWGVEIHTDTVPDVRAEMEFWRDRGLHIIIDMRTSVAYVQSASIAAQQQLQRCGNWEVIPPRHPIIDELELALSDEGPRIWQKVSAVVGNLPVDWETRQGIMMRNADRSMSECNRVIGEKAAAFVELHKDLCQDYEFWGEYHCPYVSQGLFDKQAAYPAVMREVFKQCRYVAPNARYWNGGNGMDLRRSFLQGILQEDAGFDFDVANWHPYFMSVRDFDEATKIMRDAFADSRNDLQVRGKDQPFAATEWGYPMLSPAAEAAGVAKILNSNVCRTGVAQLGSQEAVSWFERDLSCMEEFGFEVVVVHNLRDTPSPARHWGDFCGLLTVEGEKKPVWNVVQEWAWRGRETPAFGGW